MIFFSCCFRVPKIKSPGAGEMVKQASIHTVLTDDKFDSQHPQQESHNLLEVQLQ